MADTLELWATNYRQIMEERCHEMHRELTRKNREQCVQVGFEMMAIFDSMTMFAAFNPDPAVFAAATDSSDRMRGKCLDLILRNLKGEPDNGR